MLFFISIWAEGYLCCICINSAGHLHCRVDCFPLCNFSNFAVSHSHLCSSANDDCLVYGNSCLDSSVTNADSLLFEGEVKYLRDKACS